MSQNDGDHEQRENVDNATDKTCDRLATGLCLARVDRREGSAGSRGDGFAAVRAELTTAAYRRATIGTDQVCFTPSGPEVLTICRKHTPVLNVGQVIAAEPSAAGIISEICDFGLHRADCDQREGYAGKTESADFGLL